MERFKKYGTIFFSFFFVKMICTLVVIPRPAEKTNDRTGTD